MDNTDLITKARELCDTATPGPWEIRDCKIYASGGKQITPHFWNYRNAEFCARSRTLVPQLCDALVAAAEEIAYMRPSYEKCLDCQIVCAKDYWHKKEAEIEELTARAEKAEAERERADQAALNYQQKCRDIAELEQELEQAQFDVDMNKRLYETACADRDFLEAENRWIPVSERLPEKSGYCLVSIHGFLPYVAFYWDSKKHFTENGEQAHLTHWRPLPEPPKGDWE